MSVRTIARFGLTKALEGYAYSRRIGSRSKLRKFDRLHLGCGGRHLAGWGNVDINWLGEIVWDLRKPLPVTNLRYVYTEHFIEHIERNDAVRLLDNARRALGSDGVLRVSTPSLEKLVADYQNGELIQMPHGHWYPKTLCQMVNEAVRDWGHTFIYDEAELRSVLAEAGYTEVVRVKHGESEHAELRGLESRPDYDDLILEASSRTT